MMKLIPALAATIGISAVVTTSAWAKDWPEFRGPTRDGHSEATGVPVEWSASNHVAWSAEIPGHGWSSPVMVHGRIYLTTAAGGTSPGEYSLRALCFDAKSGSAVWDKEIFREDSKWSPGIHSKNSHASATPVVEGDRIYVHFGHEGTACLDLSGNKIWENRTLKYTPIHGNGGSPAIVGDILFFSCDAGSDPFVVALDKKTGEVRWKEARVTAATRKFSFSTPGLLNVDGRTQIISPGSGAVIAYNPADGKELWRARYGEGYSVVPCPIFGHGMAFIGTGFDQAKVIAVRYGGSGDITDSNIVWTQPKGAPHTASMIIDRDDLYMVSDAGIASCVDADTGKIIWSERLSPGFSASPVLAEGRLYFINEEGTTFVVKAGRKFRLLSKNELGEKTLASPAVDDGALYIRTDGHLWRVGNADGGKARAAL